MLNVVLVCHHLAESNQLTIYLVVVICMTQTAVDSTANCLAVSWLFVTDMQHAQVIDTFNDINRLYF